MTPRYFRVGSKLWDQPWSDDARLLAVYLLTCRHRVTEGLYRLPLAYAAADLRWDTERLAQPFAELLADGFIEYDEDAQLMLIVNALGYQAPSNPNGQKAAVTAVADFTNSALYGRFLTQAERFAQPLAELLRERLGEPIANTPYLRISVSPTPSNNLLVEPSGPDPETAEAEKASEEVKRLCRLIADDICRRDPKFAADKKANSAAWLKDMRLLVDADRSGDHAEVERVLRWAIADTFWQNQIMSPGNLRKQFTRLLGLATPQLAAVGSGPGRHDLGMPDRGGYDMSTEEGRRAYNADWCARFNATAPGRNPAA